MLSLQVVAEERVVLVLLAEDSVSPGNGQQGGDGGDGAVSTITRMHQLLRAGGGGAGTYNEVSPGGGSEVVLVVVVVEVKLVHGSSWNYKHRKWWRWWRRLQVVTSQNSGAGGKWSCYFKTMQHADYSGTTSGSPTV